MDVNLDELDRVLDGARETPLSEADCEKVKTRCTPWRRCWYGREIRKRRTPCWKNRKIQERTPARSRIPRVRPQPRDTGATGLRHSVAHKRSTSRTRSLKHGDRCPDCGQGNVYGQKEPKVLVRVVGQAPLAATVYSLERLRCGACGQVFTAQEPEGVGPEKYDETATAMVAQLKYGSGVPFNRLEQLEAHLGIPLPATTQWEMVEEGAELIKPARDELIRQAAQDEVLHNDDTGMKVLKMNREPGDKRTGTFTSGIVSTKGQRKDRIVLHRAPTRGGEYRRCAETTRQRVRTADSNVRRIVMEHFEATQRGGGDDGALPGPWKAADSGRRGELPRRVPLRAGATGRGVPHMTPWRAKPV